MTTEETIRSVVEAYSRGDVDAVNGYLHDNVRYCILTNPDTSPFKADCAGRGGFWSAVQKIQDELVIDRYELEDIIVSGDRAATHITVGATNRVSGKSAHAGMAIFWTVKDGRITDIHEIHDTGMVLALR